MAAPLGCVAFPQHVNLIRSSITQCEVLRCLMPSLTIGFSFLMPVFGGSSTSRSPSITCCRQDSMMTACEALRATEAYGCLKLFIFDLCSLFLFFSRVLSCALFACGLGLVCLLLFCFVACFVSSVSGFVLSVCKSVCLTLLHSYACLVLVAL